MIDLIIVGVGDHYSRILGPSVDALQQHGLIRLIATVDVRPSAVKLGTCDTPHLLRYPGQPLSKLLRPMARGDPLVYLAHAHTWHTKDAVDLVRAGFRVAIEKPYAISFDEMFELDKCIDASRNRIFLSEYYLIKSAPLLHAFEMVAPDSFLLRESGFLKAGASSSLAANAPLASLIGTIRFSYLDILEGEGDTGRFEHRGDEYADRRRGGGIIMDLGIHAFAPLVAIAPFIGNIEPRFRSVESAISDDFLQHALDRLVPASEVPETYSSLSLETTLGVPIMIVVAKYTPEHRNQRRIILVGDAGEAILDLSSFSLYAAHGDGPLELTWQLPKDPSMKYLPVLRSIIAAAQGTPQFTFDVNSVCLKSQSLTLEWRRLSDLAWRNLPTYRTGTEPHDIHKIIKENRGAYASF